MKYRFGRNIQTIGTGAASRPPLRLTHLRVGARDTFKHSYINLLTPSRKIAHLEIE